MKETKKIAYLGMLIALAFVFSYVEFLLPINIGIPGAKPGFANIVVVTTLYTLGTAYAITLSIVRVIMVAFTFGNVNAMMYSIAGAILSFVVMYIAKKVKIFDTKGVSILGGIFHNVGQIIVAMFIVESTNLVYYLPFLIVTGIVTGVLIGFISEMVIKRIKIYFK